MPAGFRRTTRREVTYGEQGLRLLPLTRVKTFSILSLSPLLWWDASNTGTVTTSSGLVDSIVDLSGNSRVLSQTGDARPSYTAAAMNGLAAIEWPSGNNGKFLATSAFAGNTREIYAVVKFENTTAFTNYDGIFAVNNDSGTQGVGGAADGTAMATSGFSLGHFLNRSGRVASTTDRTSNVFPTIGSTCVIRAVSSSYPFTEGVTMGMDRAYTSLSRGWSGFIGEMFAFTTALSSTDRNNLVNYLCDKWGVA
jgi:hypothetical protein